MAYDMSQCAGHPWLRTYPNGVHVFGAMEPVLSVLDVGGFDVRDLLVIGFNASCGQLILPAESRAQAAAAALEPGFATKITVLDWDGENVWGVDYDRRARGGTTLSNAVTSMTLTDGRQVIKDGRIC